MALFVLDLYAVWSFRSRVNEFAFIFEFGARDSNLLLICTEIYGGEISGGVLIRLL